MNRLVSYEPDFEILEQYKTGLLIARLYTTKSDHAREIALGVINGYFFVGSLEQLKEVAQRGSM